MINYFISYSFSYPGRIVNGGSSGACYSIDGESHGVSNTDWNDEYPIESIDDIRKIEEKIGQEWMEREFFKKLHVTVSISVISWQNFE